jgi:hypothetical protein
MASSSTSTGTLPDNHLVPDWLSEAGLTPKRYQEELDAFRIEIEGFRDIFFFIFDSIEECPETKLLRSEFDNLLRSFYLRPREPISVALDFMKLLEKGNEFQFSKIKKPKSRIVPVTEQASEELIEIPLPRNEVERRAMVLLRSLKADPTKAIDTKKGTTLLEGYEGKRLQRVEVLRAMQTLGEMYPSIVFEKLGNKKRIRIKS